LAGDPRVTGAILSVAQRADPRDLAVVFPDGSVLGENEVLEVDPLADPVALARARRGEVFQQVSPLGSVLYEPVVRTNRTTAVIRVLVPTSELQRNVLRNWLILAFLGVALTAGATLVADRIARDLVRSIRRLDDAAQALGVGQLDARVEPDGPNELRQVALAMNLLAKRIESLLQAERGMTADLSHRMRTPVTALRAEVAQVEEPLARQRLERVSDELTLAIDEIIREAQRPMRAGLGIVTDLGSIARDRAAFWLVLAQDQRRLFTIDIDDGEFGVAVVASDLAAMVDALLDNVFSHTPEGTDFRLRVRALGSDVELVVDDQGPGLPDGFDPARGVSGGGSTGLGLDILRRTVESAGGTLALRNRAQGGSRVRATFPIQGSKPAPSL
jgi:signal transduction histidine kinase